MRYLLLLAFPETAWLEADDDQRAAWHQAHLTFHEAVGDALLAGEALAPTTTATTMRHDGGAWTLTDGPFAESVEAVGGFYLVEATDLDQVTAWGALLPDIYAVEVRPCVRVEGFD